jgi:hypothetical protein
MGQTSPTCCRREATSVDKILKSAKQKHPKCQTHNTCSFFRRARYTVITSHALRLALRKSARIHTGDNWNVACFRDVMDIVQLAMILVPVLGAAAGYLMEGVTGATSGFVIPIGPLMVAWLVGGR